MLMLAEAARANGDVQVFKEMLIRSAEQQHAEAAFALADALQHGSDGFEQDGRYI